MGYYNHMKSNNAVIEADHCSHEPINQITFFACLPEKPKRDYDALHGMSEWWRETSTRKGLVKRATFGLLSVGSEMDKYQRSGSSRRLRIRIKSKIKDQDRVKDQAGSKEPNPKDLLYASVSPPCLMLNA